MPGPSEGPVAADPTALVPVREEHVAFYEDDILAGQLADGTIMVPLRPICDALNLSWAGQRERTLRDEVLAEAIRSVRVTHTEAGGRRDTLCLPLKHLPGWLFGVNADRVKPELQEKIKRYRRECFDVLWNAFQQEIIPMPPAGNLGDVSLAEYTRLCELRALADKLCDQYRPPDAAHP